MGSGYLEDGAALRRARISAIAVRAARRPRTNDIPGPPP